MQAPPEPSIDSPRMATWWWLVAACALVLVLVAATLAIWWATTRETRTTTYRVLGELAGIRLDLGDADLEIDGGGAAVEVVRTDRFAYGAPANETRTVAGGTLSIVSRCPRQVLGSCSASYRLTVPDNVPIEIETSRGAVSLSGLRATVQASTRSGPISATGFCGFTLRASSDTGDVSAVSECSPDRLELRSRSGDVHAVVPAARYQIDAQSESGTSRVRGLTDTEDAPFQVQAMSTSGNVTVEAAS